MSSPGAHFQGRWIDSQNVNLCSDNKIQSSHTEEVLFGTALPQFQRVKINSIKVGGVAGNLLPNGDRFALREVLAVSKQSRSATTGRQHTVIGQSSQLDCHRAVNHPRAPQVSQQDTTQSTISTTNWPLLSSGRSWKVFSGLQCCRSQELIAEILGHCTKRHTLMWQLNLFAQHCLSACACMFARQKAKRSNKS